MQKGIIFSISSASNASVNKGQAEEKYGSFELIKEKY
jgi:hypothetical protein